MKEFVKKYSLIVFLVMMIIILAFLKSFFGNKSTENGTSSNLNQETTSNNSSIDLSTTGQPNTETGINETNSENEATETVNPEEIKKAEETFEKLNDKYESFENVDEREAWVDSLSPEEQDILSGEEITDLSQLNKTLPYEGNTFIVKSIPSNNLLLAKNKIDNLDKAEADLREWLSSKGMDFEELVIAWED